VTTVGQFVDLNTPIEKINVHVRGGFIIPMQIPGDNLILGRGNPFWDDGDSIGMLQLML